MLVYNKNIMLRKLLIGIGFVIIFLPHLGLPHTWQAVISTCTGLVMIGMLFLSRRPKITHEMSEHPDGTPRTLHVERTEVEERPEVRIERETIVDTEESKDQSDTETTIEKQTTIVRRRKKRLGDFLEGGGDAPRNNS